MLKKNNNTEKDVKMSNLRNVPMSLYELTSLLFVVQWVSLNNWYIRL